MRLNLFSIVILIAGNCTQLLGRELPAVQNQVCENLQLIINSAETGDFSAIKGQVKVKSPKNDSLSSYFSSISLDANKTWSSIYFDEDLKKTKYIERVSPEENKLDSWINAISSCLNGNEWVFLKDHEKPGEFLFKNLKSRVFVRLKKSSGVYLMVYLQPETTEKCLSGDCIGGLGKFLYENGDTYEGSFFEGLKMGGGTYTWHSQGVQFRGDWLEDKMNGFGLIVRADGTKDYEGFFFNGRPHSLDTTKRGVCLAGDCKNGFGAGIFNDNSLYVGYFREGSPDRRCFWMDRYGKYFGELKNQKFDGFGYYYYSEGGFYSGNFREGLKNGRGKDYTDSLSHIQGIYNNNEIKGSEFNSRGVLTNMGTWKSGNYIPDGNPKLKSLLELSAVLDTFVKASFNGFENIKTKNNSRPTAFYIDSELKSGLPGAIKTGLSLSPNYSYHISCLLTPREETEQGAFKKYELWREKLKTCLSEDWEVKIQSSPMEDKKQLQIHSFTNKLNYRSIDLILSGNTLVLKVY